MTAEKVALFLFLGAFACALAYVAYMDTRSMDE
jgi:hypothetical protein